MCYLYLKTMCEKVVNSFDWHKGIGVSVPGHSFWTWKLCQRKHYHFVVLLGQRCLQLSSWASSEAPSSYWESLCCQQHHLLLWTHTFQILML